MNKHKHRFEIVGAHHGGLHDQSKGGCWQDKPVMCEGVEVYRCQCGKIKVKRFNIRKGYEDLGICMENNHNISRLVKIAKTTEDIEDNI